MESILAGLTDEQWATPSRCDGWTVREVIAHLVDVNGFWHISVVSGLAGTPTRFLGGFDPVTSPPALVGMQSAQSPGEVLERFVSTNDGFLGALGSLDEAGWDTLVEAPAGFVPARVLAHHAMWDAWIHERDVVLPLGLEPAVEDDEARACLRFAAAISPALGLGLGCGISGAYAVAATDPQERFVLDVGDTVDVRAVDDDDDGALGRPCLTGDCVTLTEALSLRAPLPAGAPAEWRALLAGLATAFDAAS